MSHKNQVIATYTLAVASDMRALLYRVVDADGALSVANGHRALGILASRPNSGQFGELEIAGVLKATAGATITTPGYPLTTAASGYVIAAVSGSTVIGRFIAPGNTHGAAAASGDMITGMFNFLSSRRIGAGSGYV